MCYMTLNENLMSFVKKFSTITIPQSFTKHFFNLNLFKLSVKYLP